MINFIKNSLLFCVFFLFLTPNAYSNDVSSTKVKIEEKERSRMIKELTTIKNSSENKEFPVFRELINITLQKDNFSADDYKKIMSLNQSKIFKQSLQMERQELEDMRIQMQLQYMQPEE